MSDMVRCLPTPCKYFGVGKVFAFDVLGIHSYILTSYIQDMIDESQYQRLPIDEDNTAVLSAHEPSPRWRKTWSLFFAALLAVSLLLLLSFLPARIPGAHTTNSPSPEYQHCGNSTDIAKSRGCQFDLLNYVWLPERCIEKETVEEFRIWLNSPERQFGSWPFFADREGHERIANEQALSERVNVDTRAPQEEHLAHCIFLWRRLVRVADMKVELDIGMGHIHHCTEGLLSTLQGPNPVDAERPHSVFQVGFGGCRVG